MTAIRTLDRRSFVSLGAVAATSLLTGEPADADVGMAEQAAKRSRVISACAKHWPENNGDCSGFVKAVVRELHLGVVLSGQANDICDQIAHAPWSKIGVGNASAAVAGVTAGEGKLVIAGLPASDNGHVAVVVDYRNAFDSYAAVDRNKAVAFWGQLHSVGKDYTRITKAWTAIDLNSVFYAYLDIPA